MIHPASPGHRVYAFHLNKKDVFGVYNSAKDAAWQLDQKSEYLHSESCFGIERAVETSKGIFDCVSSANAVKPSAKALVYKPNAGKAGKSSTIILYDRVLRLFVEFKSKN